MNLNSYTIGLQRRIKELEREKVKQKQEFKACRQRHVQMIRDRKTMQVRIQVQVTSDSPRYLSILVPGTKIYQNS